MSTKNSLYTKRDTKTDKNLNNITKTNNNSNKNSYFSLNLIHWNSNSIKNKIKEFTHFTNTISPSIISLNETKLNEASATKYLKLKNYSTIRKHRGDKNGAGGVALLVHNSISYKIIDELDHLNLELLAIEITINNESLIVITYYNPPTVALSRSLFTVLDSNTKFKKFILMGDLNAKIKCFHEISNQNGDLLDEILSETNFLILNNSSITHRSFNGLSESILDFIICSNTIFKYCDEYKVLNEWQMASDHIPIEISLKSCSKDKIPSHKDVLCITKYIRFNFLKADWPSFQAYLSHSTVDFSDPKLR